MALPDNKQIYNSLEELELVDIDQLQRAYKRAETSEMDFSSILISDGLISERNLTQLLADLYNVPYVDLENTPVDEELIRLVPESVARDQLVVSYGKTKEGLAVAVADPTNIETVEFIKRRLQTPVQLGLASKGDIIDALSLYSKDITKKFEDTINQYLEKAKKLEGKDIEAPIIKVVDLLFEYGYQRKASDIHIEPEDNRSVIRFRVDGILHEVMTIPKELHDQVVTRIKVLSRLRTDEHQAAQDGKLQYKSETEKIDVRVSIVPTTNGEKIVMRLLFEHARRFSLSDLGLVGQDLQLVEEAYKKPYGMILVTGPTGSGKTTTLYAVVKLLNKREVNIMTIEDPVEYDLEGVNQIQVNKKTELTFAHGLRSIVRQDPDIILIGEVRDEETAGIAVNSSMTGHLVLTTLHTNDAPTAVPRLLDMGVEPFLVASSVNIVIAQRLVRKICMNCRISKIAVVKDVIEVPDFDSPDRGHEVISHELLTEHFGDADSIRVYEGKGCSVCGGTGYQGRLGLFEVMEVTDAIREAIVKRADALEIKKIAIKGGMKTMIGDGLEKVSQGITTIEELLRVTKE